MVESHSDFFSNPDLHWIVPDWVSIEIGLQGQVLEALLADTSPFLLLLVVFLVHQESSPHQILPFGIEGGFVTP